MKPANKTKGKNVAVALPAKESFELLRSLVDGAREHGNTKELEITKRAQIEADLNRDLQRMNHQREAFEHAMTSILDERRTTIDQLFSILDQALDADKDGVAIQALSSIEGIVKSSPLEPLLQTRRVLEDPNAALEL